MHVRDIDRVALAREQMVGAGERDEALGMLGGRRRYATAFSMPTVSSVGEWKISSALRSLRDALGELLLGDVGQEFAADAERPAGERHLDLAVLADRIELILEQMR